MCNFGFCDLAILYVEVRWEVTGDQIKSFVMWECHNLYFAPRIFTMIKSRRVRWVEHVAHTVC